MSGHTCSLYHGDCLKVMPELEAGSIDMVFADLPYGTTYASWDAALPMAQLWMNYARIVRPDGAIVLTASQPFTAALVNSCPNWFRCEWIWDKVNGANFANARRQPLKVHESVLVFSAIPSRYFPIKVQGRPNHAQGDNLRIRNCETQKITRRAADDLSGLKFPKSIQTFPKHSSQSRNHPTEKPVPLTQYFIETYSRPGDTILDNCMGSGSTGVAAVACKRRFIGIEIERRFYDIAESRVRAAKHGVTAGPTEPLFLEAAE